MRIATIMLFAFAMTLAGGYVAYTMVAPGGAGPSTPAERLIADNIYRPQTLYHVQDLQARPAVTAALGRLRAANICDLIYRQNIHKMTSDARRARLCGPASEDRSDREYGFFPGELLKDEPPFGPGFAVLSDTDGAMYLIAQGKHGTKTADEMEQLIVAVVDSAIALMPAKLAARTANDGKAAAAKAADEEARKRAQESFK